MSSDLSVELTAPNGVKYSQPIGLYINGEFVKSSNGQKIETINPTNETPITSVYAATEDDVNAAVTAARAAFKNPNWRDIPATDRGTMMFKLADLIDKHAETLATIETWDNGKPYSVSLNDDVAGSATVLRYYAGYADKNHGQTIDVGADKLAYTIKEPVGVCGQIIPWNFPLEMAAWKLGPALACGNTVVLKAAEQTPLSILYMASLFKEAGFPPGVINIINGHGREAGKALASHLDVDKIAFTGSTTTGKEIMKMASINMKNITLETGGKSALLIFDDAELDQAVKWAHIGIFYNQGQVCCATSRILVQEGVYDKFVADFTKYVADIQVVGDPFEANTSQGPQITKVQHERVLGFAKSGKDQGAKLVCGGESFTDVGDGKGYFIKPTIFSNVKPEMDIYKEEVFGPFVVIASFKTEEQAVQMANDSIYGLGSAVFTQNIQRAHGVARKLEAGMVWINSSNDGDFRVPFGGVKQSGIGRELGEAGLAGYTNSKAVHVNVGTRL
ncbi:hypothetical protein O988_07666 [Pseudogymnoascus sp. VKM F-3808]|nr:hypothetical protein O988_07666 [Pseudogymnoascus sp. VKM F-3808]